MMGSMAGQSTLQGGLFLSHDAVLDTEDSMQTDL